MKNQFDTNSKRPRILQMATGPATFELDIIRGGQPGKARINGRIIATSLTKVDPRKGPGSAMWGMKIFDLDSGELKPFPGQYSYKEAQQFLTTLQFGALGRAVDPAQLTRGDKRFANGQRGNFPRNNVMNYLP